MTNVDCNIKNILLTIYSIIKYSLSKTRRYLNLFYIIIRYKPKSILEVGVYKGIRSEEMIRAAKIFNKNISFYGFDLFENITNKERLKELSKLPHPELIIAERLKKICNNVVLYKGYSHKTLKKFIIQKKKIDLIFIDGGHRISTIEKDWNCCLRLAKKKTIIIMDDYYTNNKKLVNYYGCNNLVKKIKKKYEISIMPLKDYFKINKKRTGIKMVSIKI
jgi:predicted O-methyltransferase YrrM